jgi:hypothetical protein
LFVVDVKVVVVDVVVVYKTLCSCMFYILYKILTLVEYNPFEK